MHRWLPALLIVALLAGFRLLSSAFPETLPNFQPLLALLLCSVVFLKGHQRWLLPLAVWIITDPITSLLQNYPVFGWHHLGIALGVAATVGIALVARRHARPLPVLLSATAAAFAFYFLSNMVSFALDPLYAKNWQGFVQAQWTGPTGLGPTWIFLRNSLAANLGFTGLFLAARQSLPQLSVKSGAAVAR
jgi:hypothetical protein